MEIHYACPGLQTTINSAPSTGTIRLSSCSCRWGCLCPCRQASTPEQIEVFVILLTLR